MKIQYHVIELHNGKFAVRRTMKGLFSRDVGYMSVSNNCWWALHDAYRFCLFDSEDEAIKEFLVRSMEPVRVTEVSA